MKFVTDKKTLTIELNGREQIWSLKAKIVLNKKDVLKAEFREVFDDWRKWEVRLPGASVPGRLVAGSYWTEEGWDFLYLANPHGFRKPFVHNVLYIEAKNQKYSRVIITCEPTQAKRVVAWAKK